MTRPMPFTEEQMQQVFGTNMIDFAVQHGFQIEKGDRHSVHVKNSGGLYLFNHGRGYYCYTTERKGNIIDFVKDYFGQDFKGAVEMILGCRAYEQTEHYIPPSEKKPKGDLILPPKDKNFNRTIAYLAKTRGIDTEIIYAMISQGKVYQAVTEKNGHNFRNCAFVGFDENGQPRYCALRAPSENSSFRQDVENSDKTYGFCMEGRSNRVYAFEAPIDAMSHACLCKLHSIDWRADHRVAEGCLSDKALYRYLQRHPEITEIVFCYDNDMDGRLKDGTPHNHGQVQAELSAEAFEDLGYKTMIQTPKNKDFNLDLIEYHKLTQLSSLEVSEEEPER